jgi:abhydrolase domain-containing protein 17
LEYIPALYLPCEEGGTKIVIYFHGNAEDIGLAFDLLYMFGENMKMHVLAVEYPGYGLYKRSKPDEQKMKEDADSIYDYLTTICGVKDQDMILFGRSMGSGPTSYLASRKYCHSLLLMSPYMSIKDATKSLFGWAGSMVSLLVYERFRNIDSIKQAKCPCFFLHGMVDTLIPYEHSVELNNACPNISQLHLVPNMDHNEFRFLEDLV